MALLNGFKETETEQQYRRGEIYYINNASKEHVGPDASRRTEKAAGEHNPIRGGVLCI